MQNHEVNINWYWFSPFNNNCDSLMELIWWMGAILNVWPCLRRFHYPLNLSIRFFSELDILDCYGNVWICCYGNDLHRHNHVNWFYSTWQDSKRNNFHVQYKIHDSQENLSSIGSAVIYTHCIFVHTQGRVRVQNGFVNRLMNHFYIVPLFAKIKFAEGIIAPEECKNSMQLTSALAVRPNGAV